jgi:hypothetical protein
MTGRARPGSQRPALAISLADPQSMKCVPPRSKTSRAGPSLVATASWAARNGIVTRSSSPVTTIVVMPGQASTSIVARLLDAGPAASGGTGGPSRPAAELSGPFISRAPAGNERFG